MIHLAHVSIPIHELTETPLLARISAIKSSVVFVPEYEIETKTKDWRYVDGALLYELRMPFGYWEAKDEKDDLDAEIEYKFRYAKALLAGLV